MKRGPRLCLIALVAFGFSFSNIAVALADTLPGTKCLKVGTSRIENGKRFTCIKAPRNLSNPLGKKLIWSKGTTVKLESLRNSSDILNTLNSLGFGYWEKRDGGGWAGSTYVSNIKCLLYMSPSETDMREYWDYKVNTMFYAGRWVGIKSQKWIVNDVSRDGKCIEYFAFKYGGTIYEQ